MNDRELLRHIERLPNGGAGFKQLVRELRLGGGQERRRRAGSFVKRPNHHSAVLAIPDIRAEIEITIAHQSGPTGVRTR